MARSLPRGPKVKKKVFYCPECLDDLAVDPENPPLHAICPACAAISIRERDDDAYRLLLTEEWWSLCYQPRFYDLMERRIAVLDRLTAPEEPQAHARPAG